MSADAFEALAQALDVGPVTKPAHPSRPERMNANSFCLRNRVFAMRVGEDLVLKLAPGRVAELIAGGVGQPHVVGGRPMKDRVLLPVASSELWTELGRESLQYARTQP